MDLWNCKCKLCHPKIYKFCPFCGDAQNTKEGNNMVEKWLPVMYATYYGDLQKIANENGYALAIHGSLIRDMDLVLIPWIADPKPFMNVLREWKNTGIGFERSDNKVVDTIERKPHGRIAYTMHTSGGGYIDVSIINGIEEL